MKTTLPKIRVAENLKRLRKERGWSQSKLAEKMDAHLTHINRIETGKYLPSLETVVKMAQVLQVPLDYLVNGNEGSIEEIQIENQAFAEKMKLLNSLDEEEQTLIMKVIDALVTKKKMLAFLTKGEE